VFKVWVFLQELLETSVGKRAGLDVGCRLREIGVRFGKSATQEIWCEDQSDDLLTPVGRRLLELDNARYDICEKRCRLFIDQNEIAGLELADPANTPEFGEFLIVKCPAHGAVANCTVRACVLPNVYWVVCHRRLPVHCSLRNVNLRGTRVERQAKARTKR